MSYDVLVIGGGPAGLSAAVNVRARGGSVLVVSNPPEESPLWRAERVDNHLGMPAMTGGELLTAFRRHAVSAGVEFRTGKVLTSVPAKDAWYVSIGSDMEQAAALVLAGGVGNLIDRALSGFVPVMLQTVFMVFAVFIVADCCITVGVPLLFLYVWFYVGKDEKKEDGADDAAQLPPDGP